MKNLFVSYLLSFLGLVSPVAGLHRFYMGRYFTGVLYALTWGFLGVGTVIDLVRMQTLVDETNGRMLLQGHRQTPLLERRIMQMYSPPEKQVLRVLGKSGNTLTTQMVAMNSSLSLSEAREELDRLYRDGFCTKDVDVDGVEIYRFTGLNPKQPIMA